MKLTQILLISLSGLASALTLGAATGANRTEVVLFEPEKFTDTRDSYNAPSADRSGYGDSLRQHLAQRGNAFVPEGQKLSVTITDIDLAGDFEPSRGPSASEVRLVKDIYPPKIALTFRLTDASGNVLKEGKRELRDTTYLKTGDTVADRSDTLRYEKKLLDDWLRNEFARAK